MAWLGIGALPGVQAVAATTALPPFDAGVEVAVDLVGVSTARDSRAGVQLVTSDYFRTLGISVVRGRTFPASTPEELPRFALVNEAFVRLYGAGHDQELVGRRLALAPLSDVSDPSRHGVFEIVGVVGDVRNQGLQQPVQPHVYLPWSGIGPGYPLLLVSSRIEPANAIGMIRRELALIDRQVAAAQPRTLASLLVSFVALTACYIPARRAMRVEPSAALREE